MATETKTQVTVATVNVDEAGLTGLQFKVDKLNKRAKRHGMNMLSLTIDLAEPVCDEKTGVKQPRFDVTINGYSPCINGWYLAARIEFDDVVGTVVRTVPGRFDECDYSEYRTHDGGCDHCNTRRRRNDVFVLARPTDWSVEFKVVGRNCLADFIRDGDAESFARYAEFCEAAAGWTSEDLAECGRDEGFYDNKPGCDLHRFLTVLHPSYRLDQSYRC